MPDDHTPTTPDEVRGEGALEADAAEVRARALQAAWDALPTTDDLTPDALQAALDAAAAVYDADQDAAVQAMMDESLLLGMHVGPEGLTASATMARQIAASMVMAAKQFLDENPGAGNYVQQQVIDRETGDRYEVIFVKPLGRSPHQLRLDAERGRDALRDHLEAIAEMARQQYPSGEDALRAILARTDRALGRQEAAQ